MERYYHRASHVLSAASGAVPAGISGGSSTVEARCASAAASPRSSRTNALALTGDLLALLGSLTGEEFGRGVIESPLPEDELTDLEVDGDRASGMIGDRTVEFVRIDGRWFAKPEEPSIGGT